MSDEPVGIFAVASPYAWDVLESLSRAGREAIALDNFGGADPRLPLVALDSAPRGPFVVGLSSAHARAQAAYAAQVLGFDRPQTVADPSAVVAGTAELRHGAYLNAGVVVASHAVVGCHANLNRSVSIGHDCRLGFAVSAAPGATLSGNADVGTRAFIGAGAVVLPGIVIGPGAVIGAGAVVTRDVAPGAVVVGNPAKVLRVEERGWSEEEWLCPHCSKPSTGPAPVVLAPTGMVPTRAMTPHVPLTPAEVAADVAAAWEIGITSVHLHARDEHGLPTWSRDVYERLVGAVRERTPGILINVSTSGRTWSELERRADVLSLDGDLKPDFASLTPSSLNFLDSASVNAPDVVRGLARIMLERDIVPEFEIFDLGMINVMKRLMHEGLVGSPLLVNLFFGNIAGLQPTALEVGVAVERLPDGTVWSGAGLGDFHTAAHLYALTSGGGVRVGLEDSIHPRGTRERLATNTDLVEEVHRALDVVGRAVMTPDELRARLGRV